MERKERKQEILKAARTIFAAKGFDAATLDEIAQMSRFSKGALYGYFENKNDLFISVIESELDIIIGIIKSVVDSFASPVEKIRVLVQKILTYFDENREFFCIFTPERGGFTKEKHPGIKKRVLKKYEKIMNLTARIMKDGVKAKVFKKINPEVLSLALVGLVHSFISRWVIEGRKGSLKKEQKMITEIFLNGSKSKEAQCG